MTEFQKITIDALCVIEWICICVVVIGIAMLLCIKLYELISERKGKKDGKD